MRRRFLAIGVMFVGSMLVAALLGEIDGLNPHWVTTLVALGAATVGGYIARTHFVALALLVQAAIWLIILYTLHSMANGQSSYAFIASYNAVPMAASFLAAGLGAYLGQVAFGGRRLPSVPAA